MDVPLSRIVIFCHDRSTLGDMYKPTVDFVDVLNSWFLVPYVQAIATEPGARILTPTELAKISYLVRYDHWLHNQDGPMPMLSALDSPDAETKQR